MNESFWDFSRDIVEHPGRWQEIPAEFAHLRAHYEPVIRVWANNGFQRAELLLSACDPMNLHGSPHQPPHAQPAGNAKYLVRKPGQGIAGKPASAPEGSHTIIVPNVDSLNRQPVFGTGTCVDLAKHFGAPYTGTWVPGPKPDKDTPKGTLVGTFYNENGTKFANKSGLSHVGALLSVEDDGITLMDQYAQRRWIGHSEIHKGGTRNYNSNSENYRIILFPTAKKK